MKYTVRGLKTNPTFYTIRRVYGQLMDSEVKLNNQNFQRLPNGIVKVSNGLNHSKVNYKETLKKLMEFDTNFSVLKKINPQNTNDSRLKLKLIVQLLDMLNIKLEDLNKLNVIHVAGTKGKGSTCAYVESILRKRGYKTGLYTSPHLVSVRERIRLSGQPVSVDSFTKYFWEVVTKLSNADRPGYFMFLTILSFYIFIKENVDVAIIETGIGGEFDCTNIVPKPIVTGISSLGIDHTSVLGDSLESIAWHKAGILKPNVVCFTSSQPESALQVIYNRSSEKSCKVLVCPPMEDYESLTSEKVNLGIDGQMQRVNASLALQISRYFHNMISKKVNKKDPISSAIGFPLEKEEIEGLAGTNWLGRCHLITRGRISYFLDGAHTVESLDNCLDWFRRESYCRSSNRKVHRILLFFSAGLRQFEPLIQRVAQEPFDEAIFPFNYVVNSDIYPEMMSDSRCDVEKTSDRIVATKEMWQAIQKDYQRDHKNCYQFSSLNESLQFLESHKKHDDCELHVLVTGSLIFVGNVLTLIDPNPSCFMNDDH